MPRGEGPVQILLVEDTPSDVVLFHEGLKSCPWYTTVRIAEDGETALNVLFQEGYRPDLIILDINLPKVTGYDVLRRVKDSALRSIPVIIFSSTPQRMEPPHADAYERKPLYLDEYIETVRKICNEWLGRYV